MDSNTASLKKKAKLNNPYEGRWAGRQLTETVEEFLERLPPATAPISKELPWIYIANPFAPRKSHGSDDDDDDDDLDAPHAYHENYPHFILLGEKLLQELSERKTMTEQGKNDKSSSTIAAAITKERNVAVRKIHKLAIQMKCTSGKV